MAEVRSDEALLPSLLDRLTDHHPEKHAESRRERVVNLSTYRRSVESHLEHLLNTVFYEVHRDLDAYPNVRCSVLNYGMPELTGSTLLSMSEAQLEGAMKDAVKRFEPRVNPASLSVKVSRRSHEMNHRALQFVLSAELWATPVPLQLYLKTELDLTTSRILLKEHRIS